MAAGTGGLPRTVHPHGWHRLRRKNNVTALLALVLSVPLGLAVIYGLAAVLWYELLRTAVLSRIGRRRDRLAAAPTRRQRKESERAAHAAAEREVAEASDPDPARRLSYLARKSAAAERDLAVQTVNAASEAAVARIEARYREIVAELGEDEAERLDASDDH
jgi:hypothetical protein